MLGVAAAVALGFAIFRGGVRLNMARFFTLTSVVLVLVAAGLVMTAAAHRERGRLAHHRSGRRPRT